jgi:hypothetical protein
LTRERDQDRADFDTRRAPLVGPIDSLFCNRPPRGDGESRRGNDVWSRSGLDRHLNGSEVTSTGEPDPKRYPRHVDLDVNIIQLFNRDPSSHGQNRGKKSSDPL